MISMDHLSFLGLSIQDVLYVGVSLSSFLITRFCENPLDTKNSPGGKSTSLFLFVESLSLF
jgi:hypothetical protein